MSALSLGGHSENGFSLDPSSTQAFKAIGSLKDLWSIEKIPWILLS